MAVDIHNHRLDRHQRMGFYHKRNVCQGQQCRKFYNCFVALIMVMGRALRISPVRHRSFVALSADQRGAVSLEMPVIFGFMMLTIFLPMADLAIVGFQYISAYQALRDVGQWAQYHTPPDVTIWNSGTWYSSLPTTAGGYSVSLTSVICGDAGVDCSSGGASPPTPRYYVFQTSFQYSPLILATALGCKPTCTYTLTYSERFE